jgi:hypothetical protein
MDHVHSTGRQRVVELVALDHLEDLGSRDETVLTAGPDGEVDERHGTVDTHDCPGDSTK